MGTVNGATNPHKSYGRMPCEQALASSLREMRDFTKSGWRRAGTDVISCSEPLTHKDVTTDMKRFSHCFK